MATTTDGAREMRPAELRSFTRQLLGDLFRLERMIEEGAIESDARRLGAEQELFLIDPHYRPRTAAVEILEQLEDPRFTAELGRFNLEINLDPQPLEGRPLSRLEAQLEELLERLSQKAAELDTRVLLTGILPTLDLSHLDEGNMTPKPRYRALDRALRKSRGGDLELFIKGIDELRIRHPNVMVESCNTSFQVHLQVSAEDFPRLYNAAQLAAAPILAAASNSPLLFGKRLWHETRIALFEQSIDDRRPSSSLRRRQPRVGFGSRWVAASVLEIFREDVARHGVLMGSEPEEDAGGFQAAEAPELEALCFFNGTVWRWNRPCYGVTGGKPHLRIENRVLPAGPTVADEMANAALWIGLVRSLGDEYGDLARVMDFRRAKESFFAAAQLGLDARLHWPGRESRVPAEDLLSSELLPRARQGLAAYGIETGEADRYLAVVEERLARRRTPSRWQLASLEAMGTSGTASQRRAALCAAAYAGQVSGEPVARWPEARLDSLPDASGHYRRVRQIMSRDPFAVHPDQWINLVTCLMDWHHLRHVPVEDDDHRLVGLVTYRSLLRHLSNGDSRSSEGGRAAGSVAVRNLMIEDVVTVTPETAILDAVRLMQELEIGCLPVVEDGRLVGLVSERDLLAVSRAFLEDRSGAGAGARPHPLDSASSSR